LADYFFDAAPATAEAKANFQQKIMRFKKIISQENFTLSILPHFPPLFITYTYFTPMVLHCQIRQK